MKKIESTFLVVYHANCNDGRAAASIMKKWLGNGAKYLAHSYEDQPVPDAELEAAEKVWVVDYRLQLDQMRKLHEQQKIVWIDHHAAAIREAREAGLINMRGMQLDGIAGCKLTWGMIYPHIEVPKIIRLVAERDVWGDPPGSGNMSTESKYLAEGLERLENLDDINLWVDLLDDEDAVDTIINIGQDIYEKSKSEFVLTLDESAATGMFKGLQAVFVPGYPVSDRADWVSEKYPGYLQVWHSVMENKNGDTIQKVSLRSRNNTTNCATLAQEFGGNGHKGAAGFTLKDLTPVHDLWL
jgi:uncharacterized protein